MSSLEMPLTFLLPEDCLDKGLGFLKYEHYGAPVNLTKEELLGLVPSQYFDHTDFLAMDCEMVGVGRRCDSVLARVSIVNEYGYCIYDKFVKPTEVVQDFRTGTSGIHENDLEERGESEEKVLKEVKDILEGRTLVGHSVHNDLEVLSITHPKGKTRDTADYFRSLGKEFNSLKDLVKQYLNVKIQHGEHSSIQDAQATMKLYLLHKDDWEKQLRIRKYKSRSPDDIKTINIYPRKSDLFANSQEMFLRRNKVTGAYHSAEEYLDIHWRLLHEDFMRPLRLGIKAWLSNGNQMSSGPSTIRVFKGVTVRKGNPKGELKGRATLHIPVEENKLNLIQWEDSKCLINGSLLIITPDNFKTVKLATVDRIEEDRYESTLKRGILNIKCVRDGPTWKTDSSMKFLMVESVAFFEGYLHTLQCLQHMKLHTFPLAKYIVGGVTVPGIIKYSKEVQNIDFSRMLKKESIVLNAKANINDKGTWPAALQFGLNKSQYEAFQAALTQEISIIQGPPGTGKTYLGFQVIKAFLTNPHLISSTLLVVAHTNHALDNILEPVLKFARQLTGSECRGNELMLRVGGGSKSEEVSKVTLKTKKSMIFWKLSTQRSVKIAETGIIAVESFLKRKLSVKSCLEEIRNELNQVSHFLTAAMTIDIRYAISKPELAEHKEIHALIYGYIRVLNEWLHEKQPVIKTPKPKGKLGTALEKILPPESSGLLYAQIRSIKDLLRHLRLFQLRMEKISIYFKSRSARIAQEWANVKDFSPNYANLVQIIGMTSTGAAKHKLTVIGRYKPSVMIVEEAAHVLESHVVAALTVHVKQLILIGDHQQLRPSTADYHLTKQYGLDVSLMERLVENGKAQGNTNWVQLNVQHRMRPEIAQLVSPIIYRVLVNHLSVTEYPDVVGVARNMFFIDHRCRDSREQDTPSHFNEHEAEFIARLFRYLIKQGYSSKRISIITTYMGQKNLLERKLRNDAAYKNLRICCVDGFQGEENDIILLSMVRSNDANSIGFLKTDNRVCVALSRARHGLFIVGNMEGLASSSKTWAEISKTLVRTGSIGEQLSLRCKAHGKTTRVSSGLDFGKLNEEGCPPKCPRRQVQAQKVPDKKGKSSKKKNPAL